VIEQEKSVIASQLKQAIHYVKKMSIYHVKFMQVHIMLKMSKFCSLRTKNKRKKFVNENEKQVI
jgi:hypothetical protein